MTIHARDELPRSIGIGDSMASIPCDDMLPGPAISLLSEPAGHLRITRCKMWIHKTQLEMPSCRSAGTTGLVRRRRLSANATVFQVV